MKKGFTLIELLVVIVVISVVTVSATISFMNIDNDTTNQDLKNKYMEIQRAASMYIDLNDSWLNQFAERREMFIKIGELKNTNYISSEIENPVTNEEIPSNYTIKLYITDNGSKATEYVDSCIVDITSVGGKEIVKCIANNKGEACGCCNYETDAINNPKCTTN